VMTAACVLAAVGVFMNAGAQVVSVALVIVVSGTLLTIMRRTRHIIQTLEAS
jgi:uncharacterized membrane protein